MLGDAPTFAGVFLVMDQLLLRPEEAAKALGIGRSKLFELLTTPGFPVVRIGRATRIPSAALERWIESHLDDCDRGRTHASRPKA